MRRTRRRALTAEPSRARVDEAAPHGPRQPPTGPPGARAYPAAPGPRGPGGRAHLNTSFFLSVPMQRMGCDVADDDVA
jgi:hypothetical protein